MPPLNLPPMPLTVLETTRLREQAQNMLYASLAAHGVIGKKLDGSDDTWIPHTIDSTIHFCKQVISRCEDHLASMPTGPVN